MHEFLACALATHRPRLLQRWEESLRALPPSSALAHPDALVHLMPATLDRIRSVLAKNLRSRTERMPVDCRCGMNPLITFFITAEAALIETLFTAEPTWAKLTGPQREDGLAILRSTLHAIADDDIEAFCSLCQMRVQSRRGGKATTARPGINAPGWDECVRDRPLAPHR
ncbi:MAG TPA: hypothetical protein VGD88_17875 [Opitutaceae bacterium]